MILTISRRCAGAYAVYLLLALPMLGCGTDVTQQRKELAQSMHDSLADDLAALISSAKALQAAAPNPTGRGWDATQDAAAITQMKQHWRDCRTAYEHTEGALAPIFPDLDASLDARYDDFLSQLNGAGDTTLFDDQGVTGMHAIERILYADAIPSKVVDFESTLPGYAPAAFPSTEAEANQFKTKLVQRLIDDATKLQTQWQPAAIDVGEAFQGLVSLMNEQREKVNKAATGEEESRYAQLTLFDLRNNLAGTAKIYGLFQKDIKAKTSSDKAKDGPTVDATIESGFSKLSSLYDSNSGDALPPVPASWSSDMPSQADLATPFGQLWSQVHGAVDPNQSGSVVAQMNDAALILDFPTFVEGQ
ncbi:MAG: imelysin family protein [Myxococcaceae bacterium]